MGIHYIKRILFKIRAGSRKFCHTKDNLKDINRRISIHLERAVSEAIMLFTLLGIHTKLFYRDFG